MYCFGSSTFGCQSPCIKDHLKTKTNIICNCLMTSKFNQNKCVFSYFPMLSVLHNLHWKWIKLPSWSILLQWYVKIIEIHVTEKYFFFILGFKEFKTDKITNLFLLGKLHCFPRLFNLFFSRDYCTHTC